MVAVLLALGALLCLGAVWSAYAHKPGDPADYLCAVDFRPGGMDLPVYEFNEGSLVEGRWTLWPMGRSCTWHSTLSERTVTYHSVGWGPTWLMLTGLTLAGAGGAITFRPRRTLAEA